MLAGTGAASAGAMLTIRAAEELGRAVLVVTPEDPAGAAEVVRAWLAALAPHLVLNVAGPRASEWPEGHDVTTALLLAV